MGEDTLKKTLELGLTSQQLSINGNLRMDRWLSTQKISDSCSMVFHEDLLEMAAALDASPYVLAKYNSNFIPLPLTNEKPIPYVV